MDTVFHKGVLSKIVDEVIVQLYNKIMSDKNISEQVKDNMIFRGNSGFIKLAALPLYKNEKVIKSKIEYIKNRYNQIKIHTNLPTEQYLVEFIYLYILFSKNHPEIELHFENLKHLESLFDNKIDIDEIA